MKLVSFSSEPDKKFLELVYDEFFVSRGRGLGLERHFPFVVAASPFVEYAYLREDDEQVAGLVMKDCSANMGVADYRTMSIGLVCVHPDRREQGLGKFLLEASIEYAKRQGFDAITLWTSKWRVYESVGFTLEDDSLFGWARQSNDRPAGTERLNISPTILRDPTVGIPPFGVDTYELYTSDASVSIVIDRIGPIVASWKGNEESVAQLMSADLPDSWRINARQGDLLLEVLTGQGWSLDLKLVNLQMWLSLNSQRDARFFSEHSRFHILDRI